MKKKFLSTLLTACMIVSLLPLSAFATERGNQTNGNNNNDAAAPQEEWHYEPVMDTSKDDAISLMDVADSDKVRVTVKAEKLLNVGDDLDKISGAEVSLYTGGRYVKSFKTNSNGVATVDLSSLSLEEKLDATVSAKKVISRGSGIDGSDRDALFNSFPEDNNGNYYRYTYELHSESIDKNGNWLGAKIPFTMKKNQIDIVFIIDATGSMGDEINSVKNNITSFAQTLINNGFDARFSIIEYRDITVSSDKMTTLHTYNGSNWYKTSAGVIDVLSKISVSGGGDTPETTIDALGMAASSSMNWRSGASKYAFVLTDAGFKTNNNYGYSGMDSMITALKQQKIITSVITDSSYKSAYQSLYEKTGGIYASISSSTFASEMQKLAENVVSTAAGDMELTLSEPRLLYNLSVCYLADDATSQSASYKSSMKNMLNEYAKDVARTTDGHVLIDRVALFSTNDRMNFFDTSNKASMADIQIQTRENDDGTWLNNVTVHSNAYITGFYYDDKVGSNDSIGSFDKLKNKEKYENKQNFYRIQMSGIEGAGWNNSFIDAAQQYATTVTHETGHYLFGFFDEYMNENEVSWRNISDGRPNGQFYGLMDNQHEDIEMSKTASDYSYFGGTIPTTSDSRHTKHSSVYHNSCEGTLADLLINGNEVMTLGGLDGYRANYTYAGGGSDRTADYSYAGLDSSDYISVSGTGINTMADDGGPYSRFEDMTEGSASFGNVSFVGNSAKVTFTFVPETAGNYTLYVKKMGESSFRQYTMTRDSSTNTYTVDLPITYNSRAEIYLVKNNSSYKYYSLDRSNPTSVGYIFQNMSGTVYGYTDNSSRTAYTIVDDRSKYTNGEYFSVNNALMIQEDNSGAISGGELYSVASQNAEINYEEIAWFLYKDGRWTKLATDLYEEENKNIGARADISSGGTYVLMAKKPSTSPALEVTDLTYIQSPESDSIVTLKFDDPNTTTKYYNVYYSEDNFTSKNNKLVKKVFEYKDGGIEVNLNKRDRTVYLAVEVVLKDGRKSPLTKIKITTIAADSDGDGIPDWYVDKYNLWPRDGETKDIANSDDDGDGLTNLEEYKLGSDPKNPNDPNHTTITPVNTVTLNKSAINLGIGKTAKVTATITPANATNKKVVWSVTDSSVASISGTGLTCTIKGLKTGTTTLRVMTKDGGFVASCTIRVNHIHSWNSGVVTKKATYTATGIKTHTCILCGEKKTTVIAKLVKLPAKVVITSLKSKAKKRANLKWKKVSNASGYLVYLSTSKNFKSNVYRAVFGKKTVSLNLSGFKSKKTYYFKIRAYRTVSGKNYYGPWSSAKKVKIK